MKTAFASKTLIALAVAIAAAASYQSLANEQPIPPPATDSALPENIPPGSPVAQVVKLVQAGVDVGVIQTYISNCPTAFNLDADKIISLTDAGLPSDLVNAMFAHDKDYLASLATAAQPAQAAPPPTNETVATENSPPPAAPAPPAEITPTYFYETLTPYGSWVEVDGYGRCWRPNVVVYDSGWRPYCDRGRWVYTDCGWYWNSDYSWGVTFHYGRWFNTPRHGWCWWPDNVWAPSWVTWRSSSDYCGWAPLPPFTVYQSGGGFCYRGENVSVSFGFGLASSCFTFVSYNNFCQPHPRRHCAPPHEVNQFYNQTTVINNYGHHNQAIVNNGVSVTVIGSAAHRPIRSVPIGSLVNANRHGWRGQSRPPSSRHGANVTDGADSRQLAGTGFRHDGPGQNGNDNNLNGNRRSSFNAPTQVVNQPAKNDSPRQSPTADNRPSRRDRSEPRFVKGSGGNVNSPTQPAQNVTATANNNAPATMPTAATTPRRSPTPNQWSSAGNQRSQLRQVNPQPSPSAPAVAIERPQRSETRLNVVQTAPRHFTPAAKPAPAVTTAPAARSATPNNWAPVASQRSQLRQVSPQPSFSTPSVAAERPQHSEPRQSFVQAAPRNITPAPQPAPTMSAPAQNPAPNQDLSPNGGGRSHSWVARNR